MQKMKNLAYIFLVAVLFTSCSEYQKILNRGTVEKQYKMATKMYEAKKYSKALRLFEKITPSYRGKPQMERIQFMVAQSNFNTKRTIKDVYTLKNVDINGLRTYELN